MNQYNWNITEQIERRLTQKYPRLSQFCQPRRILPPTGYVTPNHFYYTLMANITLSADLKAQMAPHYASIGVTCRLLEFDVPVFFPTAEWLTAVYNTDPPLDWIIEETVKWPLDAMLFVVPDSMAWIDKSYVPYMSVARIIGIDPIPSWALRKKMLEARIEAVPRDFGGSDANRISMMYSCYFNPEEPPITYTGNYKLGDTLNDVLCGAMTDATEYESVIMGRGVKITSGELTGEEEMQLNRTLNHRLMKIMLALSAVPHMIEYGAQQRPVRIKNDKVVKLSLWSPNIIGRNYRIKREAGYEPAGTHASPVMHWRKGHFRRQHHGHNNELIKTIWIEPVLVRGVKE